MNELLFDLFWSFIGVLAIAAFGYFVYFVATELFDDDIERVIKEIKGDGE